ncbi:hypothetical protein [Desulfosporosinus sp.]|uniref:hypothetical protein n=1 Tax=Desulfosporosinus sp. TaxID=157907 RepID=UPI0025BBBA1F|nr:hypothetical protein [Desulfosporosinus sp.]
MHHAGRKTGRFPPAMRQGRRFGRNTVYFALPLPYRIQALVWHDERMVDQVCS